MAVKLSTLSARILAATDASVATAIGGGTSAAEVLALRELLTILGNRKDLLFPALTLSTTAKAQITPE